MGRPIALTCDSACDIPKELQDKHNLYVIPLNISYDTLNFRDNGTVTTADIYRICAETNSTPKTAAFAPYEAEQLFSKLVAEGYDVIHISLSSELSSCYQNALIAKDDNEHVYVVDSKNISLGQALVVLKAVELRDMGLPAQRIYEDLLYCVSKTRVGFVLDTLDFIHRGGRCSSLTYLTANLVQMKVAIKVIDGELKVGKKYRGKVERISSKFVDDTLENINDTDGDIILATSGGIDEKVIKDLQKKISKNFKNKNVQIYNAGCTIASHCGPGTIGIAYIEK